MANLQGDTIANSAGTGAPNFPYGLTGAGTHQGFSTTATTAGTTTLTKDSNAIQYFTGSSSQTVILPVTTTLSTGYQFQIVNLSTGNVTVQSSGANTIVVVAGNSSSVFTCILASGTTAASWSASNTQGQYIVLPVQGSAYYGIGATSLPVSSSLEATGTGARIWSWTVRGDIANGPYQLTDVTGSNGKPFIQVNSTGVVQIGPTIADQASFVGNNIRGVSGATNATTSFVGEVVVSNSGSPSTTAAGGTNTATNIVSMTLTGGDWDVWAVCYVSNVSNATTLASQVTTYSISLTSVTHGTLGATQGAASIYGLNAASTATGAVVSTGFLQTRLSLAAGSTTVYLVGTTLYSAGGPNNFVGSMCARRRF